jgi:proline iminopeptidase
MTQRYYKDIDWPYNSKGAAKLLPQVWHSVVESLPIQLQQKPLKMIYLQLISSDEKISRVSIWLDMWQMSR